MDPGPMNIDLTRAHYLRATAASRAASLGETFRSRQERLASENLTVWSNVGLMNEFISRRNSMKYKNTLADT